MPLSLEEVQRIAELARIGISDAEARTVLVQLNDIFELIGRMQKVDTEGVETVQLSFNQFYDASDHSGIADW